MDIKITKLYPGCLIILLYEDSVIEGKVEWVDLDQDKIKLTDISTGETHEISGFRFQIYGTIR